MVCKCCGKRYKAGARGYDAEKRQCVARVGCLDRALGATPGKSEAKRLRREHVA
jgi:hypothetical protein